MKIRNAFTMIELIFVIVIMGIIGKFGVEFLAQAYNNFIYSGINNTLQANSAATVEFIARRLQNRIKDSIIVRTAAGVPVALSDANALTSYPVLEWVGADMDGFRGNSPSNLPAWSGIVDIDLGNNALIVSPQTDTTQVNSLIDVLSYSSSDINDTALYFIGSSSDITTGYGWDLNLTNINLQQGTMHPINSVAGQPTEFAPKAGTANFQDVYEYYKLAWTAYAIVYTVPDLTKPTMGTLTLYYGYQPWNGDTYLLKADGVTPTTRAILMENVSTFQSLAIGSVVKIQICVKSDLMEAYSLCKEKTVF